MTKPNVVRAEPQTDENMGSFYMGRMRATPEPRRMLPKGVLSLVILASFGALLWYAYPQGQEKYSDIDIPVIAADKATYKFKPDDPGGMQVLHQDSTVFNPLEKKSADAVEKLRPTPEEPIAKPETAQISSPIDKTPHTLDLQAVSHGTEKLLSAENEKPPAMPPVKEASAPETVKTDASEAVKIEPAGNDTPKTEPAAAAPVKADDAKPEPEKTEAVKEEPAPKTEAAVKPEPKAAPKQALAAGSVYIQFGAFRTLAEAKAEWSRLQKKFSSQLGKLPMHTEKVDLGAKGVLTRLQAGSVPESRAKEICSTLKAGGQAGCILVH